MFVSPAAFLAWYFFTQVSKLFPAAVSFPVNSTARCRRISLAILSFAIFWNDSDNRIAQARSRATIKDVAFDRATVFQGEHHIAAIVECFFQCGAQLIVGRDGRDPSFEILMLESDVFASSASKGRDLVSWGIGDA